MRRADSRRVAIVGSGPAALYLAEQLLDQQAVAIEVDMFERLPTPWGLVRAAVAPDHPEKKLVADRLFAYTFKRPQLRFFGNVELGRHLQHHELKDHYDAVFYATGADSDTAMGIPGEELPGCWAAREFVAWYNGHPDFSHLKFDLSCRRAVVVGNGNVALDVARILTTPVAELAKTDIADHALAALAQSQIEEVVVLGRRSDAEAAFNNPELEELAHITGVDVVVDWNGAEIVDRSLAELEWSARRKIETLRRFAERATTAANKKIVLRFLSSPAALLGEGRVTQLKVANNRLEQNANGDWLARPGDGHALLDTGLVLRAIGYRGRPFPGLPFDQSRGVVENRQGRVCDGNTVMPGVYVCGWIKRGAKGVIGSNKKCASQTVACFLEDVASGALPSPSAEGGALAALLQQRQVTVVDKSGWLKIDKCERIAGRETGRPRVKLTTSEALLSTAG